MAVELEAAGVCPPDLRAQDSLVTDVLGDGFRVWLVDRSLTLIGQGGAELRFILATSTAEAPTNENGNYTPF